jgi:hypothetical protein
MKTALGMASLRGEGARPIPQGDAHHGPQHGVRAWGTGCFPAYSLSLCPMNAPHPFAIFRVIHAGMPV